MKKFICLLMAVLMLGLCACADTPAETTPSESTPEVTPEATTPESTPEATAPESTPEATTPESMPEATTPESTPESTPETTPPETAPDVPLSVTLSYDDHLTELGGISAEAEGVEIDGGSVEIKTYRGAKYFHACGVGSATVTSGDETVEVTVTKAKINIVVIMGQSNSGNHFVNATSDIACPLGTAYWWGNGLGTAATAPVDFNFSTKGFHSTLLAELYAQSVSHGDPVKNVLVWHEGGGQEGDGTSKNGSRIYGWAKSATDASGTDYTVEMVNDCVEYYSALSDKYEIVSKGAYWLQGEGDGGWAIPTDEYIGCFMAMWNKLKAEAGLEYMAIMRVRCGGGGDANNDIDHTTVVSAQFTLANENPDIYMATTITENFVGKADTLISIDISSYITMMEKYSGKAEHTDFYNNDATYKDGVLTTSMKTLFGSNNNNHYGKFGYTIIAADAARNMYEALNGVHGDSDTPYVGMVLSNLSGAADAANRIVADGGETVEVDISDISKNLRIYALPGSVGGTLSLKVESGGKDVTEDIVLVQTGVNSNSLYVRGLKKLGNATVTVTYTKTDGTAETVVFELSYN